MKAGIPASHNPDHRVSLITVHWDGYNNQWLVGEMYDEIHVCDSLSLCYMAQLVPIPTPTLVGRRDGDTFDPEKDEVRLSRQMLSVYDVMKDGQWRTLLRIAALAYHYSGMPISQPSVSARLRDFRKPRFGAHTVERRRIEGGLFEYRLVWNEKVPRP